SDESSTASDGSYVHVPNDTKNHFGGASTSQDYAEYCFTVDTSGTFNIEVDLSYEGSLDLSNSFFVEVSNLTGPDGFIYDAQPASNSSFNTTLVSQRNAGVSYEAYLTPGDHYVRFHLREDGLKLDKVALVRTAGSQNTVPQDNSKSGGSVLDSQVADIAEVSSVATAEYAAEQNNTAPVIEGLRVIPDNSQIRPQGYDYYQDLIEVDISDNGIWNPDGIQLTWEYLYETVDRGYVSSVSFQNADDNYRQRWVYISPYNPEFNAFTIRITASDGQSSTSRLFCLRLDHISDLVIDILSNCQAPLPVDIVSVEVASSGIDPIDPSLGVVQLEATIKHGGTIKNYDNREEFHYRMKFDWQEKGGPYDWNIVSYDHWREGVSSSAILRDSGRYRFSLMVSDYDQVDTREFCLVYNHYDRSASVEEIVGGLGPACPSEPPRTSTPTPMATNTPTKTSTPIPTNTPINTPTPTVTSTPVTPVSTNTPTATPATPVSTNTPTNTPTATNTPVTPVSTNTPTNTPIATNTPVTPVSTSTLVATNTPTLTLTPTATNTPEPPPEPNNIAVRKTYVLAGQPIAQRSYDRPSTSARDHASATGEDTLHFIYTDHLGSANTLVDQLGVQTTTRFTPFGEVRGDGTFEDGVGALTERGFTGHHENRGIGLTYMNARYYVPGIGKFASADIIVPNPTNPQSYNRFSYVRNNPVNFNDPTGHCEGSPGSGDDDECWVFAEEISGAYDLNYNVISKMNLEQMRLFTLGLNESRNVHEDFPTLITEALNRSYEVDPDMVQKIFANNDLSYFGVVVGAGGGLILGFEQSIEFIWNFDSSEFSIFFLTEVSAGSIAGAGVDVTPYLFGYNTPSNDDIQGFSFGYKLSALVYEYDREFGDSYSEAHSFIGGAELGVAFTVSKATEIYRLRYDSTSGNKIHTFFPASYRALGENHGKMDKVFSGVEGFP
ncbi:MAG: RHS repeat-associated core domain-containing protein, partial [Chloroflexota bacterium]